MLSPGHVHNESLKLKGMDFHGILEEAMSTRKQSGQGRQREHQIRTQVVMNNFVENRDKFKNPNVMSENRTSKNEGTYRNKSNKVFLIGDTFLNRINKGKSRKEFIGDWIYFKCFSGANTKQLHCYFMPMLVDQKPNTTFIHIGSHDITKSNYHDFNPHELVKGIANIGLKYKYHDVSQIAISSILARSNKDLNKF